jgi:hypothetical protein
MVVPDCYLNHEFLKVLDPTAKPPLVEIHREKLAIILQ